MTQERLFRLAVEAMHLHVTFVPGDGWHFTVTYRRQGESWSDAYRVDYDRLSTSELADLLGEEVGGALGIS